MGNHRRNWSSEEKLAAVQTLKSKGVSVSSREYSISSTTLYKWERQYDHHGIEGLKSANKQKGDLKASHLEKENRELKLMIAEKELELRITKALLKKNH
jgi:transposase-like protein